MEIFEAINEIIEYRKSLNQSKNTIYNLRKKLYVFALWLDQQYNLKEVEYICLDHIQTYQIELANKRSSTKGLPFDPAYINQHLWAVRSFIQYLYKHSYIYDDISCHIENVKEPNLLPKKVMSHKQFKKMVKKIDLNTATGCMYKFLFELMYSSGTRINETVMLDIGDVSFREKKIHIRHGKGNKERYSLIGETAVKAGEFYLASVRPNIKGSMTSNALFLNRFGRRLSCSSIENAMEKYVLEADLPEKFTPHSLRKGCTTELIKAGASPFVLAKMLGWEDISVYRHYCKLNLEDLRKAMRLHPREKDRA